MAEDLWNAVADYIYKAYTYESIEKIYLSGDGANCIKAGTGVISKRIFVLDRYHLDKAVKIAGAHMENAQREIWRAIKREDMDYLKIVLETIVTAQNQRQRQKR